MNEVIREVLNFLFIYFFFYEKILYAPKSTKSTKSTKKHKKNTRAQPSKSTKNANKRTKTKNAP